MVMQKRKNEKHRHKIYDRKKLCPGGQLPEKRGFSHTHSRRAFLAGLVTVNGRKIVKSTPLAAKETVVVAFADEETNLAPSPMKQKICYEDEDILVIDKGVIPAMPCKMYPDHTLANELCGYFQSKGLKRKVRMLGRLDKETTGLWWWRKIPMPTASSRRTARKTKATWPW